MWPLSLVLLFATATPQQDVNAQLRERVVKAMQQRASQMALQAERRQQGVTTIFTGQEDPLAYERNNTCYTVRSYMFRRQDGQAPVLVGTSTCTPANKLQQRQVKPQPGSGFVPLSLQVPEQAPPE